MSISVISQADNETLQALGVSNWPIWQKQPATFPWFYEAQEVCYLLEGEVLVTPSNGVPIHIQAGDLVTFSQGLRCTWQIIKPLKKHYHLN
ncbi:MAG: cupin domain-containing protein [Thiomicrospira sp.]|jgi:uncharacterized cupin superfamily protein|nr:cupin domain-containing protein [Thiomicrospira sp.]